MPFARPTVTQLKQRAAATLAGRIKDADGRPLGQLLPTGPLRVFADSQAGLAHENNGFVEWAWRQAFPDLADAENMERAAAFRGVKRKAATTSTGAATVSGTVGTFINAGRALKRVDGARYLVVADTTLATDPQDLALVAETPGVSGDCAPGTLLTFVNPIAGVSSSAEVVDDGSGRGMSGGFDLESNDRLLFRFRQVVQTPPQGGAEADYVKWALEVPGVTRAWCRPEWDGAGSVGLTFVLDDDPVDIIPGPSKLAEVLAYVEGDLLHPRRPVCADTIVFAPTPLVVDYDVELVPNSPSTRAAVEAAIRDLHDREADLGVVFLRSHVDEAIATATDETDHVLNLPAADVVPLQYELPVPGTFTFS